MWQRCQTSVDALIRVLRHHFGEDARGDPWPAQGAAPWFPVDHAYFGLVYLIDPTGPMPTQAASIDELMNHNRQSRWRVTEDTWTAFSWNPRIVYVRREAPHNDWERREVEFTANPKPGWDELLEWADDLAVELWTRRPAHRVGDLLKEARDRLLGRGIEHPRGSSVLDTGSGLQHMPALTYLANRSAGAGVDHPRVVMRDKDGGLAEFWTERQAHEVLEPLADATNTLESARNRIDIRHAALLRTIKDPKGGLPETASAADIREARVTAYRQLYAESAPDAMDRLMLAEAAKLRQDDDLPTELALAREVLIERLEARAMARTKEIKGAKTQQGVDVPAACHDMAGGLEQVGRECALGIQEVGDAADVAAAKAAFDVAATKIAAVTPLNVPEWSNTESTATGHQVTIRADHPSGQAIPGRVRITLWRSTDGDGKPLILIPRLSRPGGGSAAVWAGAIPAGTKYPVGVHLEARSLCGPSVFKLEIDDPSA